MHESAYIVLFGALAMTTMAFGIVIFVYAYQKKIRNKKLELQQIRELLKNSELNATYKYLEGQTTEKKRIASELHDQIGSQLMVLKLKVDEQLSDSSELSEKINYLLSDVRRVSHDLSEGMFSGNNLIATFENYLSEVERYSKLTLKKNLYNLENITSDQLGKGIYNIVQELIHNTLKHAKAHNIFIEINYFEGDYLNLIYQDDGQGFDVNVDSKGMGLTNIKKRLKQMYGEYHLSSQPGEGVEIVIEIPLDD